MMSFDFMRLIELEGQAGVDDEEVEEAHKNVRSLDLDGCHFTRVKHSGPGLRK